jgi:pimeloyl-ACP methyl ester carboxylesterase
MKKFLLLIQVLLFGTSLVIQAKTINDSIPSGKNFDKAAFRLWVTDDSEVLNGIVVLMPGSNGDGRGLVDEQIWQELARKYHFALIGCFYTDFQHDDMMIESYVNAKEGSGQALLDVISGFAKKSGHSELADAPVLLWGHSAGGEFNYEFVCWKPERVIAFVVNKGGFYYSGIASKPTRNVPGIFFTGEKDMEARKNIVKGIFYMNRRAGALWAFAEEPGTGHEPGQTQKLASIFFEEIIPLRIQHGAISELQSISANEGYLGDFKSQSYVPAADGPKSDTQTAWLPGYRFAEAWQSFIRNKPF